MIPILERIANTAAGLQQLLAFLKKHNPAIVCLEATGGDERMVVDMLQQHHFQVKE